MAAKLNAETVTETTEQTVWEKLQALPSLNEQPEFIAARQEQSTLEDDLERLSAYINAAENDIRNWGLPGNGYMRNPDTERKRLEWRSTYDAKRTRLNRLKDDVSECGAHARKYHIEVRSQFEPALTTLKDRTEKALADYKASLAEEKKLVCALATKGYPVLAASDGSRF